MKDVIKNQVQIQTIGVVEQILPFEITHKW